LGGFTALQEYRLFLLLIPPNQSNNDIGGQKGLVFRNGTYLLFSSSDPSDEESIGFFNLFGACPLVAPFLLGALQESWVSSLIICIPAHFFTVSLGVFIFFGLGTVVILFGRLDARASFDDDV
jgi:hypothetical protein